MEETLVLGAIAGRNLLAGWGGFLLGVVSGAAVGLFFWREAWMGGYGSWRRRLVRLGHIAFFGLGFVNVLYGLTLRALPMDAGPARWAGFLLIGALVTMSPCCFLAAWKQPLRHLFVIPVSCALGGISVALWAWCGP